MRAHWLGLDPTYSRCCLSVAGSQTHAMSVHPVMPAVQLQVLHPSPARNCTPSGYVRPLCVQPEGPASTLGAGDQHPPVHT
jgi:hypothetical protein